MLNVPANSGHQTSEWLKDHKALLPPEELPPERIYGKRVRFVEASEKRLSAPDPKARLSEQQEREVAELLAPGNGSAEFDADLEAEDQNRSYRELSLTKRERATYDLQRAGMAQPEIARKLGVTRQGTSKLKRSIEAKMGRFYREQ